jgi:predicted transcriptional regulator
VDIANIMEPETKPKRGRPRKNPLETAPENPVKSKTPRHGGDRVSLAFRLFEEGQSIPDIAHVLSVTTKTVEVWRDTRNWNELRVARETSSQEIVKNLYARLATMASNPDSNPDDIAKISSAIERITDKKANSYQALQAMQMFLDYLSLAGKNELVRDLAEVVPDFIEYLMKMQL